MVGFVAEATYQLIVDFLCLVEELLLPLAPAVPGGLVVLLLLFEGSQSCLLLGLQLQLLLDQQLLGFPQLAQLLNNNRHHIRA